MDQIGIGHIEAFVIHLGAKPKCVIARSVMLISRDKDGISLTRSDGETSGGIWLDDGPICFEDQEFVMVDGKSLVSHRANIDETKSMDLALLKLN